MDDEPGGFNSVDMNTIWYTAEQSNAFSFINQVIRVRSALSTCCPSTSRACYRFVPILFLHPPHISHTDHRQEACLLEWRHPTQLCSPLSVTLAVPSYRGRTASAPVQPAYRARHGTERSLLQEVIHPITERMPRTEGDPGKEE